MIKYLSSGAICVTNIYLWAHVGVLHQEREYGQEFSLDFSLWPDMELISTEDDISIMSDYSLGIKEIQRLALNLNCKSIEFFAEQILDRLELIYGSVPMNVFLRKCYAPVSGFDGSVGVKKTRHFPQVDLSTDFNDKL